MVPQHHRTFGPSRMLEWMYEDGELEDVLGPIDHLLLDRRYVRRAEPVAHSAEHHDYPHTGIDPAGTIIEFYNYIRHYPLPDDPNLDFRPLSGPMPPCDLAPHQALLERRLPSKWKGKVFFKNIEDCPACSACGLKGNWAMGELQSLPLMD
jgi:hypothetical protein